MTSGIGEDLLVRGLDDWVHLAEVAWVVKSANTSANEHELVEESLKVIRGLLAEGFAEIGDVTDGGFFEWNVPIEVAIDRVWREWTGLDHDLLQGDVCWLANTELGNERAQEALRLREGRSDA